jgi:hypothetical protein
MLVEHGSSTVVVSGVLAASSAGLTVVYKFWKLRIVEDHERVNRAGICKTPPSDSQGAGTLSLIDAH